jgi:hypothetical protein
MREKSEGRKGGKNEGRERGRMMKRMKEMQSRVRVEKQSQMVNMIGEDAIKKMQRIEKNTQTEGYRKGNEKRKSNV